MSKKKGFGIGLGVLVVFLLIFLANSKSGLARKLLGPIEGSDSIFTNGNNLSVVSKNNQVFTWQWDNFKKWPTVAKPKAEVIIPIKSDRLVYAANSKLILTDLKAEKELARLTLPYDTEPKKLVISSNGQFGLVSLAQKDKIKIALFNSEFKDLPVVFEKSTGEEKFTLFDYAVNDEGTLIAGVGKKDKAWVFVKDIKNDKILWEKTFDEYEFFTNVKFSPDGKALYVTERVRFIEVFDSAAGERLKTYEMPKYETPPNRAQNISCIAFSPDNKIFAADTEPAGVVWLWDIVSGQLIKQLPVGASQIVSGLAFSPDSKYLATCYTVKPIIKIWEIPETVELSR